MIKLSKSLAAWNTTVFADTFKREVGQLSLDQLPLQQALTSGSVASKENLQISINRSVQQADKLIVDAGIFYSGIIAGCNCADYPTPTDLHNEYCELRFAIDLASADTVITICG
ncbi:MAG: hypothetical protein QNJ69_04430 [Gammaproteobacteria bacterium]|nr:hypothetical protein [Gammaproteobacteria bacterium]